MIRKINIGNLSCLCSSVKDTRKIAYILYPVDMLNGWIEQAADKYGVTIVVITGMDWQNVFSPWAARGVPEGDVDFKGESREFLTLLQDRIIPRVETELFDTNDNLERSLIGVSMSGLFALWQWMVCDTFVNIASLSPDHSGMRDLLTGLKAIPYPPRAVKDSFCSATRNRSQKSRNSLRSRKILWKSSEYFTTLG